MSYRMMFSGVQAFLLLVMGLVPAFCYAGDLPLVKSRVVDAKGRPVAGAYIFFYDSADTKRAVDLVSPVTGEDGSCEKEVPPGHYWVLARVKKNRSFDMGPLLIEDKFSGDPMELELAPGDHVELDFTVMDLLDTIKTKTKKRQDLLRVSGVVKNDKDEILPDVFVFANLHKHPASMPEYFSAWTDNDGRYTIYLPRGIYYLGASAVFATDHTYQGEVAVTLEDANLDDVTILLAGVASKRQQEPVPEVAQ